MKQDTIKLEETGEWSHYTQRHEKNQMVTVDRETHHIDFFEYERKANGTISGKIVDKWNIAKYQGAGF